MNIFFKYFKLQLFSYYAINEMYLCKIGWSSFLNSFNICLYLLTSSITSENFNIIFWHKEVSFSIIFFNLMTVIISTRVVKFNVSGLLYLWSGFSLIFWIIFSIKSAQYYANSSPDKLIIFNDLHWLKT